MNIKEKISSPFSFDQMQKHARCSRITRFDENRDLLITSSHSQNWITRSPFIIHQNYDNI